MKKLFALYAMLFILCFANTAKSGDYLSEHFCDQAGGQEEEAHPLAIPFYFEPREHSLLLHFQGVYRVLPTTGISGEYGDITGFSALISEDRKSIAVDNGDTQYIFRGCRTKGVRNRWGSDLQNG